MSEVIDVDDSSSAPAPSADEVDVRRVAKPLRHPLIFERFGDLGVGESFVLVNNHDPVHLREEFERDHPTTYGWEYLERGERLFRIRITRRTATDVPRVLGNTLDLVHSEASAPSAAVGGAVWKLESQQRQLDSNVIRLGPHHRIDPHDGPEQDVLLHVLAGSGQLTSEGATCDLVDGSLVWLPRRSRRSIAAGPEGLSYLSVHTRRPGLAIARPGV